MKSKWRYIWVLPILFLTASSIPKIFTMDFMVSSMETTGLSNIETTLILLGIIELLCVIIFLIPRTRNLGFLLTTAFIGGVIATEWMEPTSSPITGILLEVLLWIGMYFENPDFFKIPPKGF